MNFHDRLVVVDQGPVVVGFGLSSAALGVEQEVERDAVGVEGRLHGLHFLFSGDASIEVGLSQAVVQIDVANRVTQLVRNFELEVLEQSPFASNEQFLMSYAGEFLAEADRDGKLQAQLPLLEAAVEVKLPNADAGTELPLIGLTTGVLDWLISWSPNPIQRYVPVASNRGSNKISGSNQLQFTLLDLPLFLTDFDACA